MNNAIGNVPSRGKRILFWFCVLLVILACVPSAPTPAPTLAPQEISLLIQQTADAASVQTLTAVPTFTITPTFTATPRNTFTPESTNTPFVTFVLPTPTPTQREQFFRVKHDNQLAEFNFKSRTAAPDWPLHPQTPETVPMFASVKKTAGTARTPITSEWESYMNALNGFDKQKLKYLKSADTALFNTAGFPQMESLTMGGNVITLDQVRGNMGLVHTLPYGQAPTVDGVNYKTRPDLVQKFVVVVWDRKTKSTYWVNPPPGVIYWPLVSKYTVWIEMERLEPFPKLPMTVTAMADQDIRTEPDTEGDLTGQKLLEGESVEIVQYHPSGSQVWGRIFGGNKWIALFLYQKKGPTYFTSWKMETLPPP